eukprot:TRINITY_DN9678_c0_g1_i1.p1 TRINITY_DN9678_c0_g1~~TRINITY_DN9678_c0_g1_i1.p1  ORF type:complete len:992 (-),score=141.37 TRINITY_DN9678_c0_g1_i1:308-3283(-)
MERRELLGTPPSPPVGISLSSTSLGKVGRRAKSDPQLGRRLSYNTLDNSWSSDPGAPAPAAGRDSPASGSRGRAPPNSPRSGTDRASPLLGDLPPQRQTFGVAPLIRLETLPVRAVRFMVFVFWAALVASVVVKFQETAIVWKCNNVCGEEQNCELSDPTWTSASCMSDFETNETSGYIWHGPVSDLTLFNRAFVPTLQLAMFELNVTNSSLVWFTQRVQYGDGSVVESAGVHRVTCTPPGEYCDLVVLQASSRITSNMLITIRLLNPPEFINPLTSRVPVLSHFPQFTYSDIFVRCILLVLGLPIGFNYFFRLYRLQSRWWLPEQTWMVWLLGLHGLYLNPAMIPYLLIPEGNQPAFLAKLFIFMELHFTSHYINLQRAFQWVLLSCIAAPPFKNAIAFHTDTWLALLWWAAVVAVDLALLGITGFSYIQDALIDNSDPSWLTDVNARSLWALSYGLVSLWALSMVYTFFSTRTHLKQQPYLPTRHRRLAMIFFFYLQLPYILATAVYWVWYILQDSQYRSLVAVSSMSSGATSVGVVSLYTLLTAFAYSPVASRPEDARDAPPPPEQRELWARVKWHSKWLRWLDANRGAALYFFETEEEKIAFEQTQLNCVVQEEEETGLERLFHLLDPFTPSSPHAAHHHSPTTVGDYLDLEAAETNEAEDQVRHLFCFEIVIELFVASMQVYFANPTPEAAGPEVSTAEGGPPPTTRQGQVIPIDMAPWGYELRKCITKGCNQAMVCVYGTRIVVAFRGTDNLGNVRQDLFAWRTPLDMPSPYTRSNNALRAAVEDIWVKASRTCGLNIPRAHTGFLTAYTALRRELMQAVMSAAADMQQPRVYLTGHSLGGAMAYFAAYDIAYSLQNAKVLCYTFGAPRAGNSTFAQYYDALVPDTYRIVNKSDVVTTIPPSFLGLFRHVGKQVNVDTNGNMIVNPSFVERFFSPFGTSNSVATHSMYDYERAMLAVCYAFCVNDEIVRRLPCVVMHEGWLMPSV